ncbi:hypothetical protein TALC_01202 [Thermoplasmatales archaeon BRNA1]|nr:hypothetical protein TALC_01202 [Thermoplasmatales archaeon BRNA1]
MAIKYKTVNFNFDLTESGRLDDVEEASDKLNDSGKDGWELVNTVVSRMDPTYVSGFFIFKKNE